MSTDTGERTEAWIPTVSDFGSRLALVRHRMGWNVKEAARECGLPAATWRLWEVDGAQPRNIVTVCMAIASRTGVDYLWLVHGPDSGDHRVPSGRYGHTRILTRKTGTVQVTTPGPISPPTPPLVHIRPVRQLPSIVGQRRRPASAAVL